MGDVIRVGMIGCDTSHCGGFARRFHDPKAPSAMKGLRVVAAYPSFSPDLKSSASRVDAYKKDLAEKHGVKMVDSVEELVDQVLRQGNLVRHLGGGLRSLHENGLQNQAEHSPTFAVVIFLCFHDGNMRCVIQETELCFFQLNCSLLQLLLGPSIGRQSLVQFPF